MSENSENYTDEEKSKSSPSFFNTIIWILAIYSALLLIDKNVTKLPFFRTFNQKITSLFKETPKKKGLINKPMESTEETAVADFSTETYQIYNSSEFIKSININGEQKDQILRFLETKNKVYAEGIDCNSNKCHYCSNSIRGIQQSYYRTIMNKYIENNSLSNSLVIILRKVKENSEEEIPNTNSTFNLGGQIALDEIRTFFRLVKESENFDYICTPQDTQHRGFCSKRCLNDFNNWRKN